MNKLKVVVLVVLIPFAAEVAGAQEAPVVIVKATVPGLKSEASAITQDQLRQLYEKRFSPHELFQANSQTDLDTIQNIGFGNIDWGVATEESLLCFFDPPAPCYIKAVGIQVRRWGNAKFCNGFCLRLARANYSWDFSGADWQGDSLFLGVWKNNTWEGNNFEPPLGRLMWGDFPTTAFENTVCWTEMVWLGEEPDTGGEPFQVVVMPYGEFGAYMATLATAIEPNDPRDNLKLAHYRHDIGWIVYNYALNWYVVVEYYGNKPPIITFDRAGSTMELGSRLVTCAIVDEDETDVSRAGVAHAFLHFSINNAVYDSTAMVLKSGTIQNGIWAAEIPGDRVAGDVVTYYFSATDRGDPVRYVGTYRVTYRIFKKKHELLLIVDGDDLKSFFPLLDYKYDYWSLFQDGPIYDQLVRQYHHIIACGELFRLIESDDIIGNWIGTGTANEPKNYFLSSATWANAMAQARGVAFGPNDWHNAYLGVELLGPLGFALDPWSALPLNAIPDDVISGKIASFCGDSMQLYYLSGEADAFTPTNDAYVCFRDSARGLALGCHKEGEGFKSVFLSFDYRFLFTKPQFWITYHYDNLLGRALEWFGTPRSQVKSDVGENPSTFHLFQNYPNPFNSTTTIEYGLLKPDKVTLTIFNLRGEKIATLVDKYQTANNYKIIWDAHGLPTSIYFCKMETENFSKTSKMILIK